MLKIDSVTLTQCIEECFALARNPRLSEEQATNCLVAGKLLRGALLNVISAIFRDGTPEVLEANQNINELNQKLKQAGNDLSTISDTTGAAASLASLLGNILGLATAFV